MNFLFPLQLLSGTTFIGAVFCFGAFCSRSLYGFIPLFAVGELLVFATQVLIPYFDINFFTRRVVVVSLCCDSFPFLIYYIRLDLRFVPFMTYQSLVFEDRIDLIVKFLN